MLLELFDARRGVVRGIKLERRRRRKERNVCFE